MTQSFKKIGLPAVLVAVVCTVAAATHWPALSAKALSFDDQQYLTRNVLVQNPGWPSTKRFLTEVLEPSTVQGYYQSLAMISLMLDYAAGGRENNLRPFHITSLSLHIANTALIIVLLYLLFGNIWAAAAAGLLFAVHPMTVEPIPWVGERKTLLAAFFALWSLIFYARYARSGSWKSYGGCFVMYLLALMSKPTSVPLPLVMLLMDYWPLQKLNTKSILEKVPLFVFSGVFAVITYISQTQTAGTVVPTKFGLEYILLVLCHNIIFYLYKIILPINLSSHYAFPKPLGLSNPMVLAGVIGTCVLIPLLITTLRRTRAAMTGWLIFFVAILPAMGVIGFTNVIASDKFAYLPSVGLLMILTSFLILLGKNRKVRIATVAAVLTLTSTEAIATQKYLAYWKDSIALYNHMLALTPDAAPLYNNLGFAMAVQGNIAQAVANYRHALQIDPNHASAITNLGCIYNETGRSQEAVELHKKAIGLDPSVALAHHHLASAYGKLGQHKDAMEAYKKALKLNSDLIEARYGLGVAYANLGRYKEAAEEFEKVAKMVPYYPPVHYNLAMAYRDSGRKDLALRQCEILKSLDPNSGSALERLLNESFIP